jgi:ABC-type branched-subunit amino acid transport system ATPase component
MRDGLSGLSDADRSILKAKADFDDVRSVAAGWMQRLHDVVTDLGHFRASVASAVADVETPANPPDSVGREIAVLASRLSAAFSGVQASVASTDRELAGAKDRVEQAKQAVDTKLAAYDAEYEAVKKRSSAHETKLAELAELDQEHAAAREHLQKQEAELAELGDPASRHAKLREELIAVRAERTALLQAQCDDLSALSDGLIRASLGVGLGMAKVQERFRGLTTGSSVRAAQIELFFEQLLAESSPGVTWEVVLSELEKLMLLDPDAEVTSEQTPVMSRLGLRIADQRRIMPRLTPDGWLDLSLTEVTDRPSFEYRAKEDQYIPFEAASAGQQASALLTTLLSQQGTPLIIDQPEEDLDSDTVQQIVSKIWEAKSRRQIVFASHNANLVVNGDADLVLVCAYVNSGDQSAGHIKLQGAIDMLAVRDEITAVMEGGERAFKLRKEKYGF